MFGNTIKLLILYVSMLISHISNAASVSITIDDFNIHEDTTVDARHRNQKILSALKKHKVKSALFVVGKYIQDSTDEALLLEWQKNGHLIGNHTLNHKPYNSKMSFDDEKSEILKCEDILKKNSGFEKYFRFPMLSEGDTPEKRDQLRSWLTIQGYKIASVTIDASDWYIDQRLREKLAINPKIDLKPYREFYLTHIWDRSQYYNELSKKILGREVKHALLIHFNLLNALFLDDLLAMFKSKGWNVIDARDAFTDPTYDRLPNTIPSGQSLLWGLAKETGKYDHELRYPGEDDSYEKPKMDALGL